MIYVMQPLLNSGSKLMNVNGGTPKTFSFSPGGVAQAEILGLSVLIKETNATPFNKFGALTALTNGVVIQWSIGGITTNYMTLKDNADVALGFPHHQHFGNGAVLSILSVVTPEGFGNTTNMFKGEIHFPSPILLGSSDSISAIVQDNLSAMDVFQIAALYQQ